MIRICNSAALPSSADLQVVENAQAWLARYRGVKPAFACVLSFTETGLVPNISAAGFNRNASYYTALADGAFLAESHLPEATGSQASTSSSPLLPLNAGISPAVITKALLTRQKIPLHILSTGLPGTLAVPHISLPQVAARAVSTGQAMSLHEVHQLFESGLRWGERLAMAGSYLIVGECVVGGTTTAQAVLSALGYQVQGKVSSSHRYGNHSQKQALIEQGLATWHTLRSDAKQSKGEQSRSTQWITDSLNVEQLNQGTSQNSACFKSEVIDCKALDTSASALEAVAAVGDPMQAVVAGIALSASRRSGVLLAGGSQMLAVYALAKALSQEQRIPWNRQQVVVGTTRWVVEDKSADTVSIANAMGAPYFASQLSFSRSPYSQLRAYEQGYVKEGVGAGGCAIAAHLYQHWTNDQIRHAVEAVLRRCL